MSYYFEVLPVHPQPIKFQSQSDFVEILRRENNLSTLESLRLLFPEEDQMIFLNNSDFPLEDSHVLEEVASCSNAQLLQTSYYHLAAKFGRNTRNLRVLSAFVADCLSEQARISVKRVDRDGCRSLEERLILLKACPEFGTEFIDKCPRCHKPIPLFHPSRTDILTCVFCQNDFSLNDVPTVADDEVEIAIQVRDDLRFFLEASLCELYAPELLVALGSHLDFERRKRNLMLKEIAQLTKIPSTILAHIENGRLRGATTFLHYWDYAEFLGLRLRELYELMIQYRSEGDVRFQMSASELYEDDLLRQVKRIAQNLYAQGDDVSEMNIARALGYTNSGSLKHYPRIRQYFREDLRKVREQQLATYESTVLEQVKLAHQQLINSGQYASQNLISQLVGISTKGLRSYKSIAKYLDRIIANHEAESARRESELYEAVQNAANQLQNGGQKITQTAIAQLVGMTIEGLKHYKSVKKLMAELTNQSVAIKNEEALLTSIRNIKVMLNQAGKVVTPQAIADTLGRSTSNLYSYPRVREIMIEIRNEYLQQYKAQLESQVSDAVKLLDQQGEEITQKRVAEMIGLHTDSLRYYPEIEEIFAEIIALQKSVKETEAKALYDEVVMTVKQLRKEKQEINDELIARKIGKYRESFRRVKAIDEYLNRLAERQQFKDIEYERRLASEMVNLIEKLRSEGKAITQELVAELVGVPIFTLRKYKVPRELLETMSLESRRNGMRMKARRKRNA